MTDRQFEEIKAALHKIVENTKPPGKIQRTLEAIGLIVTISGGLAIAEQVIKWFWR